MCTCSSRKIGTSDRNGWRWLVAMLQRMSQKSKVLMQSAPALFVFWREKLGAPWRSKDPPTDDAHGRAGLSALLMWTGPRSDLCTWGAVESIDYE